jgi:hypothetical protein
MVRRQGGLRDEDANLAAWAAARGSVVGAAKVPLPAHIRTCVGLTLSTSGELLLQF